jgi:hypothetical protein
MLFAAPSLSSAGIVIIAVSIMMIVAASSSSTTTSNGTSAGGGGSGGDHRRRRGGGADRDGGGGDRRPGRGHTVRPFFNATRVVWANDRQSANGSVPVTRIAGMILRTVGTLCFLVNLVSRAI